MRSMPQLKTGHQPKTHMASGFTIDKDDRDRYEKSVTTPPKPVEMDETALRAVIAAWARKREPDLGKTWIYSWDA
jgi:hypothetical protein